MTTRTPAVLTHTQQDKALTIVAAWLGPYLGHVGPAPTGRYAADHGLGPVLVRDWDWPTTPTPTVILEGGDGWAAVIGGDPSVVAALATIGVFAEPYSSYALCLYPY